MLVITRRLDESVQIGRDISITIVEVDGSKIRLGIEAPTDISIRRTELETCDDSEPIVLTARRDAPPAE